MVIWTKHRREAGGNCNTTLQMAKLLALYLGGKGGRGRLITSVSFTLTLRLFSQH